MIASGGSDTKRQYGEVDGSDLIVWGDNAPRDGFLDGLGLSARGHRRVRERAVKDVRAQFGRTAAAYLTAKAWLERSQTPADRASEVRRRLRDASSEARDAFRITDTTFAVPKVVILARRSA